MSTKISATFEVTNWDEKPFDERKDGAKLTRAEVTKTYSGGIDGTSVTEWLMAYAEDGTATFVGIERIDGSIGDRRGTLALRHVGTYGADAAKAELVVLAGCGSGDFSGVAGTGDFLADPSGKVELDLDS
jgi:hypothetical protein